MDLIKTVYICSSNYICKLDDILHSNDHDKQVLGTYRNFLCTIYINNYKRKEPVPSFLHLISSLSFTIYILFYNRNARLLICHGMSEMVKEQRKKYPIIPDCRRKEHLLKVRSITVDNY